MTDEPVIEPAVPLAPDDATLTTHDGVTFTEAPPPEAAAAFALAASMEGQGAAAPEALTGTGGTPAPVAPVLTDGPAVEGVDAWAAALGLHGISADIATTLATNCLRDGYAQGQKATLGSDVMADHAANLITQLVAAEARIADLQAQNDIFAEGHAVKLATKPKPLFQRLEDDVILAAEEAAYATSNLVAHARGRKPDDGIDAWRKRTGGLRHAA